MEFNYYAHIEEIAPRPILFIVGTEAATKFMSNSGFDKAVQPKEWIEIRGATHHSLYDNEAQVGEAVVKLEEFFDVAYSVGVDRRDCPFCTTQ